MNNNYIHSQKEETEFHKKTAKKQFPSQQPAKSIVKKRS